MKIMIRQKNNRNKIANLQDLSKEEKKIIINTIFSQSAILKMKKYNFFNDKIVYSYHFTESYFDKNAITTINFILKSFLKNNN